MVHAFGNTAEMQISKAVQPDQASSVEVEVKPKPTTFQRPKSKVLGKKTQSGYFESIKLVPHHRSFSSLNNICVAGKYRAKNPAIPGLSSSYIGSVESDVNGYFITGKSKYTTMEERPLIVPSHQKARDTQVWVDCHPPPKDCQKT